MAVRYATKSGVWSDVTVWDGGVALPASGDDVYANGFTVTVDQDVTVAGLFVNTAVGVGTPSGKFTHPSGTHAINLQTLSVGAHSGTATCVVELTGGSVTLGVVGAITGDTQVSGTEPWPVLISGGSHTINANIQAGTANQAHAVAVMGTAVLTVNGNVTGGSSSSDTVGIYCGGTSAQITVNGNVSGGTSQQSHGINNAGASAQITVNGNVTGGSIANIYGIQNVSASAVITVTGTINGGSAGAGLMMTGGTATIRGTLRPGNSATGVVAIASTGSPAIRFSGHVYSGGMSALTGPNGFFPVAAAWSVIDGEDVFIHIYNDDNFPTGNNGTETIFTQYGTDLPAQADVRDGVLYGPSDTLEGTLAVPPAASVAAGVPTDNTVGTAALNQADTVAVILAGVAAAISG